MGWLGHLALRYQLDGDITRSRSRHRGPLRVLSDLHPEGPGVCHHVLVHPPGGLVGGDTLELEIDLGSGSHAVITTPGATRFYRSAGETARQRVSARLAAGARLEWLPLESICHRSTQAENDLCFDLAPTAEMIGWDLLALGLPASNEAFDDGRFDQQILLPGVWRERARIDGKDRRLLDGPLGWAGRRVLATLWFSRGAALSAAQRSGLVDAARTLVDESPLAASAGATSPDERLVVLRVLAPRVEPAMALLTGVRAAWRQAAWDLAPHPPRIWRT